MVYREESYYYQFSNYVSVMLKSMYNNKLSEMSIFMTI